MASQRTSIDHPPTAMVHIGGLDLEGPDSVTVESAEAMRLSLSPEWPILLISTMAMHTQNLQTDSRASLLVTQPNTNGDPLGAAGHGDGKSAHA